MVEYGANLHSFEFSIDRANLSNLSLIQTKLRNRLGLEKTSKLVTCFREWRGSVEFDW